MGKVRPRPQKSGPRQTDLKEEYFYNVDEKIGYILHILRSRNLKIEADFFNFKISVKASDVFLAVKAYEILAEQCHYPLHLGITEAGGRRLGSVKSSIGIGRLLLKGIGDTIRVSLSD